MLKVNRKVEYGLVALKHMMHKPKDQLTSVREICDNYGTPFDPVAHVLRILNSEGLVKSEQGAHGGYRLVEDIHGVPLARFIEMIEGQVAFTDCLREDGCRCNMTARCNIINPMHHLNSQLLQFLESMTLGQLLDQGPLPGTVTGAPETSTAV